MDAEKLKQIETRFSDCSSSWWCMDLYGELIAEVRRLTAEVARLEAEATHCNALYNSLIKAKEDITAKYYQEKSKADRLNRLVDWILCRTNLIETHINVGIYGSRANLEAAFEKENKHETT